jgi:hypothetical protein
VALALARLGVAHLAKPPRQNTSDMAPLMARIDAARTISEADAGDDSGGKAELKREGIRAIASAMTQFGHAWICHVLRCDEAGQDYSRTHWMTLER